MGRNYWLTAGLTLLLAVGTTWMAGPDGTQLDPVIPMIFRWLFIAVLCWLGIKRKSLTAWILISMVVGVEVGLDFPVVGHHLNLVSKIFIRMIKTIIAPLIFATLVVGIAGHSNLKQVGRMGWKSLLYFEIVTTIALFIGLAAINLTQAGVGIPKEAKVTAIEIGSTELIYKVDEKKGLFQVYRKITVDGKEELKRIDPDKPKVILTWEEHVLNIVPENLAKSIFEGNVLQIVVFSILFGIGLGMVTDKHKAPMLHFCESLAEVMFKFTALIMYLAPIAVGAAIAYTVSEKGIDVLWNLGKLILTLYGALVVFVLGVLLPIALAIRLPIGRFIKAIAEPVTIAFATTSSEAGLPKAMKALEDFGVPRKTVAFVLPMGYSFNLDGTTLYLSLASIFVAQACGIPLTFGQQMMIVFTLMLTSKGVAGVPRASLVILMGTVDTFSNLGLEMWPVFVILGVDELMDMARTSVNMMGNCLASCVIAKWEGELDIPAGGTPPPPDAPVSAH